MSETTPRLGLPLVAAGQAQKHVPVNEALARLDALVQIAVLDRGRTEQPEEPSHRDRHIVGNGATGAWSGQDGAIASHDEAGWTFLEAGDGWFVWDSGAEELLIRQAGAWRVFSGGSDELQEVARFGLGTEADETNPFSVKLNNALWAARESGEGGTGDLRYVMNKEASADVLSLLLQSGYSGRAEIGLVGDDDLLFKVSADGSAWKDAIRIDKDTGRAAFPGGGVREQLSASRTIYVRVDGSDTNSGLVNSPSGAFATIQKAVTAALALDFSIYNVVIQVGPGIYTAGATFSGGWTGSGTLTLRGDNATPANVEISTTGACINVGGLLPAYLIVEGFKLSSAGNSCIAHSGAGQLRWQNIEFGSAGLRHLSLGYPSAVARAIGNYAISGGAQCHYYSDNGAVIQANNVSVTFLASVAFSSRFASASRGAGLLLNSSTYATGAYTVTGSRYSATMNGYIETAGGGANYLPGSGAGQITNGGQYN